MLTFSFKYGCVICSFFLFCQADRMVFLAESVMTIPSSPCLTKSFMDICFLFINDNTNLSPR